MLEVAIRISSMPGYTSIRKRHENGMTSLAIKLIIQLQKFGSHSFAFCWFGGLRSLGKSTSAEENQFH